VLGYREWVVVGTGLVVVDTGKVQGVLLDEDLVGVHAPGVDPCDQTDYFLWVSVHPVAAVDQPEVSGYLRVTAVVVVIHLVPVELLV